MALLSREGEIEIAKRIEEGKKDIATVSTALPMTIGVRPDPARSAEKRQDRCARDCAGGQETEEDFEEDSRRRAGLRRVAGQDARLTECRAEGLRSR